jgi:hypothetical protein
MNNTGTEIKAANAGMKSVLATKCLSGIFDARAKMKGITQINAKYERENMKMEATIMKTTTIRLMSGFMLCINPGLLLKSSTYTSDSELSTKSLKD